MLFNSALAVAKMCWEKLLLFVWLLLLVAFDMEVVSGVAQRHGRWIGVGGTRYVGGSPYFSDAC
jgi:hypothetical protein